MAQELIVRHLSGSRHNTEETYREFPLRIGRADDCQLAFDPQLDAKVSKHHAEVRRQDGGGGFVLVDLDSKNGLLLNGNPVEGEASLPRKATVQIGDGGPRLELQTVEGGSGISFAGVRRKTETGGARSRRPMVSTEGSLKAYVPENAPTPPARIPVAAIILVVLAVGLLLGFLILKQ